MQETIEFLNLLADTAGSVIRKYYRQGFVTETKERHDPVTEADKKTEEALRELITKTYPNDGIQGEEYGISKGTTGRVWVIDPIDGTRAFAIGRATFATLVALCENGVPVAGVIDQPIVGDRWVGAKGIATTHNGKPCKTRSCTEYALITTSPDMFKTTREKSFSAAVIDGARFTAYGGDCYAYGLIASGFADAMVEANLKAHDIMPLVPIIEGAGGIITAWDGKAITLDNLTGQTLACGDKALHQRLLALTEA